jgi:hypothetical protein
MSPDGIIFVKSPVGVRYGGGLFDLTERESVDAGLLDVRVVRADPPWPGHGLPFLSPPAGLITPP